MSKYIRYPIALEKSLDERLYLLAKKFRCGKNEIVRRALALFFYVIFLVDENKTILIRDNETFEVKKLTLWDDNGEDPEWNI